MKIPRAIAYSVIIVLALFAFRTLNNKINQVNLTASVYVYEKVEPEPEPESVYREVDAWITGYNSFVEQTDSTPCVGANGWICGRDDIVACPRSYAFGQQVEIWGSVYECQDRFNKRFEGLQLEHFDIFCGMYVDCPSKVTGNTVVKVRKMPLGDKLGGQTK